MKYFKVKSPIGKLRAMFKEIDNYYFFKRQVEIFADSGELKHYKMKMSDTHTVFGAINLPPELLLYNTGEDLDQLEKTFFGNEMAKLNDALVTYDIMELYRIEFERIKTDDYYAYVFNISYKWEHCNRGTVTAVVIAALLMVVGICFGISRLF